METTNNQGCEVSKYETPSNSTFNRIAYLLFVMLGIFYLIKKDWNNAGIYFGIALVFDPFNQSVKWDDRPLYQRVLLYVQVSAALFLFFI